MTDTTQPNRILINPLEALAQAHEVEAFSLLVEVVRDKDMKPEHRIKAAERILDQARGKPKVIETRKPGEGNGKKLKAISLSMDKLLAIAQGAIQRTAVADAQAIDAQFSEVPARRLPRNEYAQIESKPTAQDKDLEDLLS